MRSVGAALILAGLAFAGPTARAQDANECRWNHIDAPDPSPVVYLNDVVALSDNDAWAVGSQNSGGEFSFNDTLAIRWDGSEWHAVETPNRGNTRHHFLLAVSAGSPGDVWAVGFSFEDSQFGMGSRGLNEPLVLHWNGTSWEFVPMPGTSHSGTTLTDVAVLAPDDIWITGFRQSRVGFEKSLLLHYDGTSWRVVPSGNKRGQSRTLQGIVAQTSDSIWAVGSRTWRKGSTHPFALHYDGNWWRGMRMQKPPGSQYPIAEDVEAASESELWAVGDYGVPNASEEFVQRFTDGRWRLIESPIGGGGINQFDSLSGVDAISATDVWAVGRTTDSEGTFRTRAVLAHHDGSGWQIEMRDQGESSLLSEIDMLSPTSGWAVGSLSPTESEPSFAPPSDGFILRYSCT